MFKMWLFLSGEGCKLKFSEDYGLDTTETIISEGDDSCLYINQNTYHPMTPYVFTGGAAGVTKTPSSNFGTIYLRAGRNFTGLNVGYDNGRIPTAFRSTHVWSGFITSNTGYATHCGIGLASTKLTVYNGKHVFPFISAFLRKSSGTTGNAYWLMHAYGYWQIDNAPGVAPEMTFLGYNNVVAQSISIATTALVTNIYGSFVSDSVLGKRLRLGIYTEGFVNTSTTVSHKYETITSVSEQFNASFSGNIFPALFANSSAGNGCSQTVVQYRLEGYA